MRPIHSADGSISIADAPSVDPAMVEHDADGAPSARCPKLSFHSQVFGLGSRR
jgi:hypothetical protein